MNNYATKNIETVKALRDQMTAIIGRINSDLIFNESEPEGEQKVKTLNMLNSLLARNTEILDKLNEDVEMLEGTETPMLPPQMDPDLIFEDQIQDRYIV